MLSLNDLNDLLKNKSLLFYEERETPDVLEGDFTRSLFLYKNGLIIAIEEDDTDGPFLKRRMGKCKKSPAEIFSIVDFAMNNIKDFVSEDYHLYEEERRYLIEIKYKDKIKSVNWCKKTDSKIEELARQLKKIYDSVNLGDEKIYTFIKGL